MQDSLTFCLSAATEVTPIADLADWCQRWRALTAREQRPVALAMRAGFAADRLAWAFAAGYQGALRSLLAVRAGYAAGADELFAMCATEAGGNRPRDIHTTLSVSEDTVTVRGEKSWTTLGPAATAFLVVGRIEGDGDDTVSPSLKVALVPAGAPGIHFLDKAPIEFVPEMPHTGSRFDAVLLGSDAVLPGDGYSDYVKPFRTVEDTFIALAVQAWLLREARARQWPRAYQQQLAAQLVTLATLADSDASSAATHVALAGALERSHELYRQATEYFDQVSAGDPVAQRWHRDRPLFQVASKPRALRAERAWQRLTEAPRD